MARYVLIEAVRRFDYEHIHVIKLVSNVAKRYLLAVAGMTKFLFMENDLEMA